MAFTIIYFLLHILIVQKQLNITNSLMEACFELIINNNN